MMMRKGFHRSTKPQTEVKKLPFLCGLIKEHVMVEIRRTSIYNAQMQRYEPLRDEFVDCNSISKCGLQSTDAQGKISFDRERCPACLKLKAKGMLQ